eukprot:3971013-Pleurochrysis_carterae.AAC.1
MSAASCSTVGTPSCRCISIAELVSAALAMRIDRASAGFDPECGGAAAAVTASESLLLALAVSSTSASSW